MNNTKFDSKKIQKKLKLASDLFDFAFKIKSHQLRIKHPDMNEHEITMKTYALIEKGCS